MAGFVEDPPEQDAGEQARHEPADVRHVGDATRRLLGEQEAHRCR